MSIQSVEASTTRSYHIGPHRQPIRKPIEWSEDGNERNASSTR